MRYLKEILTFLLLTVTLTATAQQETLQLGCRRGTPRSEQGQLLRAVQKRLPGGDFYTGERHQLTVLVAFNDLNFEGDETATLEKWGGIMNTENYNVEPYIRRGLGSIIAQALTEWEVILVDDGATDGTGAICEEYKTGLAWFDYLTE